MLAQALALQAARVSGRLLAVGVVPAGSITLGIHDPSTARWLTRYTVAGSAVELGMQVLLTVGCSFLCRGLI